MTEITCVSCPVGCLMAVTQQNSQISVTGNECPAGLEYAKEELTAPTRNIATSIKVTGGHMTMLSVKTATPIPKSKIMAAVAEIHKITAAAPVAIGDIILENVTGTGVNIVATREVKAVGFAHTHPLF
ncbi:MAG: DUF1667 domain-containing protein [Defluviitaleaceae bacterium]|nr:DUF1667 domain-containing protein [Defluviitaleaceae bacterium]